MKHIPNLITLGRIACVPLLALILLREDFRAALYLAVFMAASDALDGFLAKRCGWQSRLGERLDPIADKLMLVSAYSVLGLQELLPVWLVALVVGRDVLIVGGFLYYRGFDVEVEIKPSTISKINTSCQVLLVFAVLFTQLGMELTELTMMLIGVVAATTLFSGVGYVLVARGWAARRGVSRAV